MENNEYLDNKNSIFDTQTEGKSLWFIPDFRLNSPPKISSSAYKKPKMGSNGHFQKRFFFIQKNFLQYKKTEDSMKISAAMNLNWTRIQLFENQEKEGLMYEITLIRDRRYTSLFFKDKKLFGSWVKIFQSVCINTDFHKKFQVMEFIDKGSYGEV